MKDIENIYQNNLDLLIKNIPDISYKREQRYDYEGMGCFMIYYAKSARVCEVLVPSGILDKEGKHQLIGATYLKYNIDGGGWILPCARDILKEYFEIK